MGGHIEIMEQGAPWENRVLGCRYIGLMWKAGAQCAKEVGLWRP